MSSQEKGSQSELVVRFQKLEQEWGEAILRKDLPALERFLDHDYALRMSDAPGRKVTRREWVDTIAIYNTHSFQSRELQAREFGEVVVVSHVVNQNADVNGIDRSGDFFIVDVWKRHKDQWKVCARYS